MPALNEHVPVLIYAPGMGRFEANSADGVSDVIAAVVDRRSDGTVSSTTDATVTAPKGLRVGKTVVDDDGTALLHVFELDYKERLDDEPSPAGPPPSPGALRSSVYAVMGMLMLVGALRRGAKSRMAKLQLALGFVVVASLVLLALVAVVSGLVAAGVALPSFVEDLFGKNAAKWSLAIGGTVVLTWAGLRRRLLALAAMTQLVLRYLENEDRRADTVAMTVDDAVDGLRDNGWTGSVHLLGYSFGSLVLFDAMFPRETSLRPAEPVGAVASVTTVGCPIDVVRLFRPEYVRGRVARAPHASWSNVFIATDVFGSNLRDGDDHAGDGSSAFAIPGVTVESTRYLAEDLGLGQVLKVKGFTTHSGYWSEPGDASCIDMLVARWIPAAQPLGLGGD